MHARRCAFFVLLTLTLSPSARAQTAAAPTYTNAELGLSLTVGKEYSLMSFEGEKGSLKMHRDEVFNVTLSKRNKISDGRTPAFIVLAKKTTDPALTAKQIVEAELAAQAKAKSDLGIRGIEKKLSEKTVNGVTYPVVSSQVSFQTIAPSPGQVSQEYMKYDVYHSVRNGRHLQYTVRYSTPAEQKQFEAVLSAIRYEP